MPELIPLTSLIAEKICARLDRALFKGCAARFGCNPRPAVIAAYAGDLA
jgi:hypothetical protein